MPWKQLAGLWTAAAKAEKDARFKGLDARDKAVLVELPEALAENQKARLSFPCGGSLDGAPLWQRRSGAESRGTLAAFKVRETDGEGWDQGSNVALSRIRRAPRVNTRLWVGFPDLERAGTVTRDLSLEGCRVKGKLTAKLGERIKIYLDLPDSQAPLSVMAQVKWVTEEQTGLRFVNLHSQDEVRLLKTLGMATVPASRFKPEIDIVSPPFTYKMVQNGPITKLLLSVSNWDVSFSFQDAEIRGPQRGAFERFETPVSSEDMAHYKAQTKISLAEARSVVCLRLFDQDDNLVFEIIGREIGFTREKRRLTSGYPELSSA